MNPVKQMIPRQRLPDAIVDGYAKGYLWDGASLEAQFSPSQVQVSDSNPCSPQPPNNNTRS